jgi:hypothetical protein
MMRYHYAWLLWSAAFLIQWGILFGLNSGRRRLVRQASLTTRHARIPEVHA